LRENTRSFKSIFRNPYSYLISGASVLIGFSGRKAISNQNNQNKFQENELAFSGEKESFKQQLQEGKSQFEKEKDELIASSAKSENIIENLDACIVTEFINQSTQNLEKESVDIIVDSAINDEFVEIENLSVVALLFAGTGRPDCTV
jgi:hypothetical protein